VSPVTGLAPRSIAVVFGTRPEHIKLAPLIRLLGPAARVIHSGQHYDPAMTGVLPGTASPSEEEPLWIGGQHRGIQIGAATAQLADRWRHDRPSAVVVQGDTNTALAGALAANSCSVCLVHVEAGLRSGDRDMPEEHNRILIDHLSDLCCAPTSGNAANLRAEAIPGHRIAVTGNPVVEAVRHTSRDHRAAEAILGGLAGTDFALATFHRPENTDPPARLAAILDALASIALPVLVPLHPRTRRRIRELGLDPGQLGIRTCDPPPYPAFLALMERARLLISDSGGIQEEATIIGRPLIVLRKSTERPEALGALVRITPSPADLPGLTADLITMPAASRTATPFGDGLASQRISRAINTLLGEQPVAVPPTARDKP
jgi:UDP-N-acetylglucosamine 2-epimerase (non-hydrolysing)